jgi:hypothetical protein
MLCEVCMREKTRIELFTSYVFECVNCPGPGMIAGPADWLQDMPEMDFSMCYRCTDVGCTHCLPSEIGVD